MDPVDELAAFVACIFGLHFLYHLFAEGADFRGTRYGHVLVAFVSAKKKINIPLRDVFQMYTM